MNPNVLTVSGPDQSSGHIILGDCIDVLAAVPGASVDLVVTDPPYLVGYRDRDGRTLFGDRSSEWVAPAFSQIYRVLKPGSVCVSFYGSGQVDTFMQAWREAGLRPVGHFVWPKSYASGTGIVRRCHEQAYLLAKGRPLRTYKVISDVRPWRYTGNRLHPTQKPVMAIQPLIEAYSKPGDLVLDPFCGSGTTAEAARNVGRRYLCIEKDPEFHRVATRRLAA